MLRESPQQNSGQRPEPVVKFESVGRIFVPESGKCVKAIDNLNLTINRGEFVTIVGATGCGKSTLLNLAAGLDAPTKGSVRFCDDIRPSRDIAYVFQHYTLLPWLNVENNVAFGLKMRRVSRKRRLRTANRLLEQVGLKRYSKSRPHELSGGMRQRAAIAQALAIGPKLLLMDEPFGAIDASTRRDLQMMLTELHRDRRMTILFVTHSIDEALMLGDRVIVLSEQEGTVLYDREISLERPRTKTDAGFTAHFLSIRTLISETNS